MQTDMLGIVIMLSVKKKVHYQDVVFEYESVEYEEDANVLLFTKGIEEFYIPCTRGVNFHAE